ncbi:hypothetical protein AAHE18_13G099100 [Arachis hypogaea]
MIDLRFEVRPRWRKVAYGGMQPGFDDNHTDESFLEGMVMNANVVRRDMLKFAGFCQCGLPLLAYTDPGVQV